MDLAKSFVRTEPPTTAKPISGRLFWSAVDFGVIVGYFITADRANEKIMFSNLAV